MSTSPASSERLLTADEFWDLPEPAHGGRMELVAGRVVTEMPVGEIHAFLAVRLAALFLAFVEKHHLGRVYVELGHRLASEPDTVRAPDVSFLPRAEGALLSVRYVEEAPALAVEIILPTTYSGNSSATLRGISLLRDPNCVRIAGERRAQDRTVLTAK